MPRRRRVWESSLVAFGWVDPKWKGIHDGRTAGTLIVRVPGPYPVRVRYQFRAAAGGDFQVLPSRAICFETQMGMEKLVLSWFRKLIPVLEIRHYPDPYTVLFRTSIGKFWYPDGTRVTGPYAPNPETGPPGAGSDGPPLPAAGADGGPGLPAEGDRRIA